MNAPVYLIEPLVRVTVSLRVHVPESHPSSAILGTDRAGTGTIVDRDGLILTVNYVVLGADQVQVTLASGQTYPGQVVAQDFASGIALVRIDSGTSLPAATLRSSTHLTLGQQVIIIASVGDANRRGNNGAITSLGRFDAYWEYTLERAILITAVNPGLGGAPLFDLHANMVGVVALDLGEIGRFSLAIPVELFLDRREELLRFGRAVSRPSRAWIGFYCYTVREHVVIAGLLPGAPGDAAGLKPGDIVLGVNDNRITARADLYEYLTICRPGDRLTFRVFRDDEIKIIEVASGNAEDFFA